MASNLEAIFGPSRGQRNYEMAKAGMAVGYQPSRSGLAAALRGLAGFGSGLMAGYQGGLMDDEAKSGLGMLLANRELAKASPPAALDAVKSPPAMMSTPEAPELPGAPPPPLPVDAGVGVPVGAPPVTGMGAPQMPFIAGSAPGVPFQLSALAGLLGNRYA